jgi:hypothetical protein
MMPRTQTTSRRREVPVEHRDIPDARFRQRLRDAFLEREAARGRGRAQVTNEPERKAPAMADSRELKGLLARGFSPETAAAMLEGKAPSPVRMPAGGGWILD